MIRTVLLEGSSEADPRIDDAIVHSVTAAKEFCCTAPPQKGCNPNTVVARKKSWRAAATA